MKLPARVVMPTSHFAYWLYLSWCLGFIVGASLMSVLLVWGVGGHL